MAKEHLSEIANTTKCRCGIKWGHHCNEPEIRIKNYCVACGELICRKVKDNGGLRIIPTQTFQRYCDYGNYCNQCCGTADKNAKWYNKNKDSNLSEVINRK